MRDGAIDAFYTLPKDVIEGKVDFAGEDGIARGLNAAGFAMTGGLVGVPMRAGEVAFGSGPIRGVPAESLQVAKAADHEVFSLATSATDAVRLRSHFMSQEIAGGHAFDKHVLGVGNPQGNEFNGLGIRTRSQFATDLENVINNPTQTGSLLRGREYFYDRTTNTIVIRNPRAQDGGTAFRPVGADAYLKNLR